MRIGLIDVDGHNYPNLPLMKLSAYHKSIGDDVEWYDLINATIHFMTTGENMYNKVYMSKVFSFSPDFDEMIYADEIERGGSGYCITNVDGKEVFDKSKDKELPYEIEHIYPDYSIYNVTDTAYGFMSRGCPRGCDFCHVKTKEGLMSHKVADLSEFWNGQKHIVLCDPNTLACKDWKDILQQLRDSKARVNFNQGLDIRMMTEEKAEMLSQIPLDAIHFAWDRYEDKKIIVPKFETFRSISKVRARDLQVYVLCGFNTTIEQDLERIYTLRNMTGEDKGYSPYVMLYNKYNLPKGHELLKLQRWVNNRFVFWKCKTFEEYLKRDKE